MRVTKVVLGLAGLLLISLVFVSFQAAAHPDASEGGIAKALDKAGEDPPLPGLWKFGEDFKNARGMVEQVAHNPLCSGHDD